MSQVEAREVAAAVETLLREVFEGAAPGASWILNGGEPGIVATLAGVTAAQASRRPIPGRASLAGHADHARYALSLLNRYAAGEADVFSTADWAGSWARQTVDEATWREIRDDLAREASAWAGTVAGLRSWPPIVLTGSMASAAHAAYHFGAIRQLMGFVEAES